jgi:hypothetical protein
MTPRGARWAGLILAIVLGQFLYLRARSAWTNYWLLNDAQKGTAIVTKELWFGHNAVGYRYVVDHSQYTGRGGRNSQERRYSKVKVGEESVVLFFCIASVAVAPLHAADGCQGAFCYSRAPSRSPCRIAQERPTEGVDSVTNTFFLTVNPVNQPPTLDPNPRSAAHVTSPGPCRKPHSRLARFMRNCSRMILLLSSADRPQIERFAKILFVAGIRAQITKARRGSPLSKGSGGAELWVNNERDYEAAVMLFGGVVPASVSD